MQSYLMQSTPVDISDQGIKLQSYFWKKTMGKIQTHLSPEKYIKTKARTLPIHECWINKDWEDSGLASIFISRRQPSGNLTVGIYLVDLKCLGVKDTVYFFNQSPHEYAELLENQKSSLPSEECDYTLAHNVIFAALEFADEYNVSPEKGFAITKYILEDDEDDSIPILDIPTGEDGMPHLILMEDQVQKYTKVLAQLRSYPGEGNFLYTIKTEHGDYDGNADEDDEDDEWDDEPLPDDFFERVGKGEASVKDESSHAIMDLMYRKKFPEHIVNIDEAEEYADKIDLTYEPLDAEGASDYEKMKMKEIYLRGQENPEGVLTELFDLTARFPQNKILANYLHVCLARTGRSEDAHELVKKNFKKFPGYLIDRLNYATSLVQRGQYDEAKETVRGPSY